jgi:hypothetical protein
MSAPLSALSALSSSGACLLSCYMPWELGVLLALMGHKPIAVAVLFAASATTPYVDTGVWRRVRRALIMKTVLEFLEFWQAESVRIMPALLGPRHNTGQLVDIAEAARLGLRHSPEVIAGPVNFSDMPKPILGGLCYTFTPATLLHAVTTDDPHVRSGVAASSPLQLHWQLATPVAHSDSYDLAAAVHDVV